MEYTINLTQYYESTEIKPLINEHIVKHGDRSYRVDRWFKSGKHCYVFVDITMGVGQHRKPFAKRPSDVQELIKNNKITITNTPYTIW